MKQIFVAAVFALIVMAAGQYTLTLTHFSDADTVAQLFPAWVQAVGSVVAIWFAGVFATKQMVQAGVNATNQMMHEKRLEKEKDLSKLKAIKWLFIRAKCLTEDVNKAILSGDSQDFDYVSPWVMRNTSKVFDSLSLFDIPGGDLTLDVLTVGPTLDALADEWERYEQEFIESKEKAIEGRTFKNLKSGTEDLIDICSETLDGITKEILELEKLITTPR